MNTEGKPADGNHVVERMIVNGSNGRHSVGASGNFIRCCQAETCSGMVSSPRADLMLKGSSVL